ncbi:MAG: hypothetical protein IKJ05_05165 [Oscillospiraceae bacterium]|nr:hypothetical protein [Oscillospiraceae bacterium]
MKKRISVLIILLFCIPYAFLGVHLELAGWALWGYFLALAMPCLLSAQAGKLNKKSIVRAGNILSLASSLFCAVCFSTERWWSFCKPFTPTGVVIVISFFMYCSSYVGWIVREEILLRKDKNNKK